MYGVFQTFYESDILRHESASNISWVGSIQAFLIFLGGAMVSPFFDLGYLGTLLSLGTFCIVFGMMMTSLCTTYWQFILAQGITVGIGFGCLFLPSVAIVSQYFTTKKAIAFGVVSTGGSLGSCCPVFCCDAMAYLGILRGSIISYNIQTAAAPYRLWLDDSHNRLHCTCDPNRAARWYEVKDTIGYQKT